MTTATDTDAATELTSEQQEWIDGLHDMYVFLSSRPDLIDVYSTVHLNQFADDKQEFAAKARLLGSAQKASSGNYYSHKRRFGPHCLELNIGSQYMCERVQVGTKKVSTLVPPEGVELIEVITEQPVYEWSCPESTLS